MKEILLSDKFHTALVDDENYDGLMNFKWHWMRTNFNEIGYAWTHNDGKCFMHRLIMEPIPEGKEIDHHSRNTLDNQKLNLRYLTRAENCHNRRGVKGYYWDDVNSKWRARIYIDGACVHLGRFKTEDEAKVAYLDAKHKFFPGILFEEF